MRYAKLRGAIKAKFYSHSGFAQVLQMSEASLSAKLNGRTEWKVSEIVDACCALGIPLEQAHEYFFCPEC